MSDNLVIVCGLMGAGKTTFARNYAWLTGKFDYIDFDREFHVVFKGNKEAFLDYLVKKLNKFENRDFIVDGWFKWNRNWYKFEEDKTIDFIRKQTKRCIIFIYLFVPFDTCYKQYLTKHILGNTQADILPEFKDTMEQRQENLLKKIKKCLNG